MFPRSSARNFQLRIFLSLLIGAALLPWPVFVGEASSPQGEERAARPRPGKPQGTLPDLEEVQRESQLEREAPAPIPSTIRTQRHAGRPWDGRRVGDAPGELGQLARRQTRRAHARMKPLPPPVFDDQFVQNFFTWALARPPVSAETSYWQDQLRVAYNQNQVKLAALELGRTLFETAEYAARNRNAHWYVYDLYKTYLMREPDAGGWATWEALVPTHGREYVRRGFEESGEFATLVAGISPNGTATANAASLISARVEPRNQPGNGMLARDASWSVPLLSLPGRYGLDLGLALAYSSQVWTRSGPYIYFDEDNGFPSAGFRLGFPSVQRRVFNAQTGKAAYLLLTPAGHRVELRHVATNVYEAFDSSYLQLTDNGASLLLRATDGAQMSFLANNGEYRCTQVKDRNGNYLTVNYNALGQITNIVDTLGRVIVFNYDGNANLLSITQSWNGQSHQWVSFGWSTRNMQYSFTDGKVVGIANGTALPVLTQVALNDTSHFTFEYTNSLQLSAVKNYFGALERNATTFTYETPLGDTPRLLSSSIGAHNWSGFNNVPAQVTTTYSVAADGACVLTAPDGTVYKEYYGTGWKRGLATRSEVIVGGVLKKWTTTDWTQDNTAVAYEVNPRVVETTVNDTSTNGRRRVIEYTQFGLPSIVKEFAVNDPAEIRRTVTDYNLSQAYLDRRIIGLVAQVQLISGGQSQTKTTFTYDEPARLQATAAAATQHDAAYSTAFSTRGNLTGVSRWDVTDVNNAAKKLTTSTNYFTTGTPAAIIDPAGHQSSVSYTDSFSDGGNRNTFAYPTRLTDADNNHSYVQYNFDFSATTRTESPAPAGQSQGAIQVLTYNNLGQLERVTTTNNGAYKRFWYGAEYTASYATVNNVADEFYSIAVTDGLGRVIGAVSNHPGSTGGYRLVNTVYDLMGRAWLQSNPTEVNSVWAPSGDDAAGAYYTQQTYDWKGRPLVTTNPDGTTREASYAGCGCAGGDVVTLTDEGTLDAGVAKRRQQKIYSDVLGRTVKTEVLNWQNGSVYSTVSSTYNARDQVERVRQYAGSSTSGTYQDTTMIYDGYGRLKTQHVPEQNANTVTSWAYNPDNTIAEIADARGASQTFNYNHRHLLTRITYNAPTGSGIPVPGIVNHSYDGAGNQTAMTDDTGSTSYSYDSLSRMTSETRTFTGFSGTYSLNYSYNLANALTSLAIPFRSQQIGYSYDLVGRLSGVTAGGFSATYSDWPNQYTQNLTSFASNLTYRASGARKSMTYGNTTSEQITYNARQQPATYTLNNMNYQNTNICCSYPTHSTMTWTYGYYNDGIVKHAWDATNEWFDRAYKYDHAGRLKEGATFRRARGLAPYPAVNYHDPYVQSITYDAFNHSNRTGKLYTGELSDVGVYVNNRRTDNGWQYDADGNTIRDPSYQHTFDAAGKMNRSVSLEMVGDGAQHPFEPRLDIAQTYDGTGTPAKREQIARLPGISDEFGNQSAPVEDTQTTYFLKSSVLGGATVVEFGLGNMVHIYAGGQRIAREVFGSVTFEHQNPVTGSWLTSHGHSSYRTTGREERDPRGAETPLSNPYAAAQSYVEWKFTQPLFMEGGDPFDFRSGKEIDGLPVSEAEFQRRIGKDVGLGTFFNGKRSGFVDLTGLTFLFSITVTFDIFEPELELWNDPESWERYYTGSFEVEFNLESGIQKSVQRRRSVQPKNSPVVMVPLNEKRLEALIEERLKYEKCADYVANLITQAAALKNGLQPAESTNVMDLFAKIAVQPKGGVFFDLRSVPGNPTLPLPAGGGGWAWGSYVQGTALINVYTRGYYVDAPWGAVPIPFMYGIVGLHEVIHMSAKWGFYDDAHLTRAAQVLEPKAGVLDWDNALRRHCLPPEFR